MLIADTGHELHVACETVNYFDRLYSGLGMADETADDVMHSVSGPELPVITQGLPEASAALMFPFEVIFFGAGN